MPEDPGRHRYSLETLGVLLERIDRDMATREQVKSIQELLNSRVANVEGRMTSLEQKQANDMSVVNSRINDIEKDDADLNKIRVSSRWTFVGAIAVAVLSLVGTVITNVL